VTTGNYQDATMQIRRILIPLSGRFDPESPECLDVPALKTGLGLAQKVNAHADVLCIRAEPTVADEKWSDWLPSYGARETIRWVAAESEARRAHAKSAFDKVLAGLDTKPELREAPGAGYSANFLEHVGDIRESVGTFGRLSDLIVVASSKARWDMPLRPILEASLRRTACPLLVAPPNPASSFGARIAIAWNDSVESARALAASLDWLKAAESVVAISCRESDTVSPNPHALLDYLAWHGITAEALELTESPRAAAPAIVEKAIAAECDLIVIGAYIHTRAHSLLFGSMTEHVFSDPKLAALVVP
jgi:nucleotide-binding universal stress UspA family protein